MARVCGGHGERRSDRQSGIEAIVRRAPLTPRHATEGRHDAAVQRTNHMQHVDFILIWLASAAFTILIITLVLIYRRSSPSTSSSDGVLPDFAIFDCGASIHLVPLEPDYHQVDNSGRCRCGPTITINKRRFGTPVRYVDHRAAAWRQSISSTVTRDRRQTSQ